MMRVLPTLSSCKSGSVMSDAQTKQSVEERLASRETWLPTMPDAMSSDESLAMSFLYAYIPLGDSFGRVVYLSKGHNTSIGEQIKTVVKKL